VPTTEYNLDPRTLSGDLRSAIMDRIRALDVGWGMMPQSHQKALAHEIDDMCKHLVKEAVNLIAAEGRPVILADCGEIKATLKNTIEAKVAIRATDERAYDLFMSAGQPILLVVTDVEKFLGEKAPEETQPDAPDMFAKD